MSCFALGQKINICNLSENDLQSFSEKLASESGINIPNISKKTSLGYVVKFEKDLKISTISDRGKIRKLESLLKQLKGNNENFLPDIRVRVELKSSNRTDILCYSNK